jgi:hypothetical protein
MGEMDKIIDLGREAVLLTLVLASPVLLVGLVVALVVSVFQAATQVQEPWRRDVRVRPGVYVCGDHRDNASINGALESGRRAAEAVLEDATAP